MGNFFLFIYGLWLVWAVLDRRFARWPRLSITALLAFALIGLARMAASLGDMGALGRSLEFLYTAMSGLGVWSWQWFKVWLVDQAREPIIFGFGALGFWGLAMVLEKLDTRFHGFRLLLALGAVWPLWNIWPASWTPGGEAQAWWMAVLFVLLYFAGSLSRGGWQGSCKARSHIRIHATAEKTYPWLVDLAKAAQWRSGFLGPRGDSARRLTSGSKVPVLVGSQELSRPAELEVVSLDPNRSLVVSQSNPRTYGISDWTLGSDGEWTNLSVQWEIRLKGFFNRMLGSLFLDSGGRAMSKDLRKLKKLVESESA